MSGAVSGVFSGIASVWTVWSPMLPWFLSGDTSRDRGHPVVRQKAKTIETVASVWSSGVRWYERLGHTAAICMLWIGSSLICVMAGCVDVPEYYWAKSGITQEQIHKDNIFCADMSAEKPSAYARGSTFYYAPLDQEAYQHCMRFLGYRKMTEAELERERLAAAAGPSIQFGAAQKICERVTGIDGDIQSCIRYMSMNTRSAASVGAIKDEMQRKPETSSQNDDPKVCLRRESNEPTNWKMDVSVKCRAHPQSIE